MPQEMILPHTLQRADYIGPAALFTKFRTLEVSCTTHSHDFFEIEWITGGSGLHLLNGVPHPLRPGSLYLLTPEDVHAVRPTPRLEYYNIMFSEDFFAPDFAYEALLSCRGVQTGLDDAAHARMAPLFEQLVAEAAHARSACTPRRRRPRAPGAVLSAAAFSRSGVAARCSRMRGAVAQLFLRAVSRLHRAELCGLCE